MPYHIEMQGNDYCVVKDADGKVMGKHPSREEAAKQMAALYANEPDKHAVEAALVDLFRNFDPNVGGGTDRDKMDEADFAGKDRSFPIKKPGDVSDAASSIGRAGSNNYSPEQLKKNIIRIAKRKGAAFVAQLPEAWKKEMEGGENHQAEFVGGDALTFASVTPGQPFRLLPFGKLVKNGSTREITPDVARAFKLPHFKPAIKLGSHDEATPAGGSIVGLEVRVDGLYAIPELTEKGARALSEGDYRYHSPEVIWEGGLEDPSTGKIISGPLIVGDALLHMPHLGEAAALFTIEIQSKEKPMETFQVEKPIWEKVLSALHLNEKGEKVQYDVKQTEEYKAVESALAAQTAEIEKMKAAQAKVARVESFKTQLQGTQAVEMAEMLAALPDEQANALVTKFKALSAQIDEVQLMAEIGSSAPGPVDSGEDALDKLVRAEQEKSKTDYAAALSVVLKAHPEQYRAIRRSVRKEE